jgi:hypothetical protein
MRAFGAATLAALVGLVACSAPLGEGLGIPPGETRGEMVADAGADVTSLPVTDPGSPHLPGMDPAPSNPGTPDGPTGTDAGASHDAAAHDAAADAHGGRDAGGKDAGKDGGRRKHHHGGLLLADPESEEGVEGEDDDS